MASFCVEDVVPAEVIGDTEFAPYVASGQIIKHVYRNEESKLEMRCYSLPTEEWRGKLKSLLFQLSWEGKNIDLTRDNRHQIDCFFLGYSKKDTEKHIERARQRFGRNK